MLQDELKEFYARFETPSHNTRTLTIEGRPDKPLSVTAMEVHMSLNRTDPRRAAGPDNIPWQALRVCASELADAFTDIFNLSLRAYLLQV